MRLAQDLADVLGTQQCFPSCYCLLLPVSFSWELHTAVCRKCNNLNNFFVLQLEDHLVDFEALRGKHSLFAIAVAIK